MDFKDALIDAFIQRVSESFDRPTKEAKYVYESTIKDTPLRRVLVDMTADCHKGMTKLVAYDCANSIGDGAKWLGDTAREYYTIDFL